MNGNGDSFGGVCSGKWYRIRIEGAVSSQKPGSASIDPIGGQRRDKMNYLTSYTSPPRNLPCGDLLGNRDDYHKICVPLYNASMEGDWKAAQDIFDKHQHLDLVGFGISQNYDTALHIAASTKRTESGKQFVNNLLSKMTNQQLQLQNMHHNTALCLAAESGNVEIAKILIQKNKALLEIPGNQGMMPLHMASIHGNDIVRYLFHNSRQMTGDLWTDQNRSQVLQNCVEVDMFDIALTIVTERPELAVNGNVLQVLARKTYAFELHHTPPFYRRAIHRYPAEELTDATRLLRIVWSNILKLPIDTVDDILRGPADVIKGPSDIIITKDGKKKPKYSSRVLFIAAKMGNTKFLVELIRQYPDLIWKTDDNNQSIFHVAVSHRHVGIYCLLYELGSMQNMITSLQDVEGNNMLHLAGKRSKTNRPHETSALGLQVQHDMLWFMEVEANISPFHHETKNNNGQTPYELFMLEHKELFSAHEKSIKETANQCLVVAAVIATIGFTAAFTLPGGYNQDNGIPIFRRNQVFIIFSIFNALSLSSSSISILIFLSIHIKRQHDFLQSVHRKLMTGIAGLLFSVASMLFCFCTCFFIYYQDKLVWVPIFITLSILMSMLSYGMYQMDITAEFFQQAFGSRSHFSMQRKHKLYYQNPRF